MNLETMIQRVKDDTQAEDPFIVGKLNSAQDWIWNRLMVMDANILKVDDDQNTLAADTSTYDLAANVATGALYQIKWLGVKFSGDTKFHPVTFMNSSDERFVWADQQDAISSGTVYAAIENFDQVRFAPPLLSGTIIRTDYIYKPRTLALGTQAVPDLPEVFHEAQVARATGEAFLGIDDDRVGVYFGMAMDKLYGALNVAGLGQTQQPFRTRPSLRQARGRRW